METFYLEISVDCPPEDFADALEKVYALVTMH